MGFWDRVKKTYNRVDRAVGGYLPGGSTPKEVKASKPSPSPSPSTSSPSPSTSSPSPSSSPSSSGGSSGGSTSSGSSGGSSGGGSSSGSSFGSKVGNFYNKVDTSLGGYLPGGSTPTEVKATRKLTATNTLTNSGSGVLFGGATPTNSTGGYNIPSPGRSNGSGGTVAPPPPKTNNTYNFGGSSGGSPNAVSLPPTLSETVVKPVDKYEGMSFGEKTKAVVGEYTSGSFWGNVWEDTKYTPFTGIKTALTPLQIYSRGKQGDRYYDLVSTASTTMPDKYTGQTGWDRLQQDAKMIENTQASLQNQTVNELTPVFQAKVDKRANLYQEQINAGNLTVEQAQAGLNKDIANFQNQYSAEAQDLYSTKLNNYGNLVNSKYLYNKDIMGDYAKFNKFQTDVPQLTLTAGLVGASFAGGIPAIVASGAVGVEGGFTTTRGFQEKDYVKAGIGIAMLGLGTYGFARGTANYMTQSNIKNVLKVDPKTVYSNRINNGKISYDFYQTTQTTKNAYAYTQGTVVTKAGAGNTFNILGGKSQTLVYTKDIWTGRGLFVGGQTTINPTAGSFGAMGTGGFTPSTFGVSTTTTMDFSALANRAGNFNINANYYGGAGKTTSQIWGGIAKQNNNIVNSFSGKVNSAGFNYYKGSGFTAVDTNSASFTFGVNNIGITRIIDPSKLNLGIDFSAFPSAGGYTGGFSSGGSSVGSSSGGSALASIVGSKTAVIAPVFTPTASAVSNVATQIGAGAGLTSSLVNTRPAVNFNVPDLKLRTSQLGGQVLQQAQKPDIAFAPPIVKSGSSSNVFTIQAPAVIQIPKINPIQIQKPAFLGRPPGSSTPGFRGNFGSNFQLPPFLLDLPSGLDAGGIKKRRVKIKKVVRYTPSYSAVIFNIRGKAPKGRETGFRVRPIPTGTQNLLTFFSNQKKRRVVKKRVVKRKAPTRKRIIKIKKQKGGKK